MNILVIDGQGGRLGASLIEKLNRRMNARITAVGTNSAAAAAMIKAGAHAGAAGENAAAVCAKDADIIAGPIGILAADSLLGEITPKTALAVGRSRAVKVLIPAGRCGILVAGCEQKSVAELVDLAAAKIEEIANGGGGKERSGARTEG